MTMGSRRGLVGGVAVFGAWLGWGCGPTVEPSDPMGSSSGDDASSGSTAIADGATSAAGSEVGTSASGGSSTGAGMGTTPMYGACGGPEDCLPGLFCTPIALPEGGGPGSICTAQCGDPAVDCVAPPDGWAAVCNGFFHDIPPDPFCAIGCGVDLVCPDGMVCGTGVPFTEPYYCIPQ